MKTNECNFEEEYGSESVETLFLMAVLGQETVRRGALSELKRRRLLVMDADHEESAFMTNLSGFC